MQKQSDILRRSRAAVARPPSARALRGARELIVMVDDDADVRSTVTHVLEDAGYEVIECADVAAAFALLSGIVPHVVLVDRELPDGSGLELAAWMRRQSAYDGVRIVAFSGRDSSTDIEAAFGAGCDDFVAKPCRPEVLLHGIRGTTQPRARAGCAVRSIARNETSSVEPRISATARYGARRG